MKGIKLLFFLPYFFLSMSAFSESFFDESVSVEQAYELGRLYRAQYKNREAREYLKFALDNGSANGAYLYSIELSGHNQTVRTDQKVLELITRSAELGSIKAARYLSFNDVGLPVSGVASWRERYFDLITALLEENQAQALFELFLFYQRSDSELASLYVKTSADLGHPVAIMVQGDLAHKDEEEKAAMSFYKAAAETKYLPAIKKYITELEGKEDKDLAFKWVVKAAEAGDLYSIAIAARAFSGLSETYKNIPLNLSKALAYYKTYLDVVGKDRFSGLYEAMLAEYYVLVGRLDESQLVNAKKEEDELKGQVVQFYASDIYWFDDGYVYTLSSRR